MKRQNFYRVYCNRKKNKKGNPVCGELLVDIPIGVAVTIRAYCRNCNPSKLYELKYNGNGIIERRIVGKDEPLNLVKDILVMEPAHE